MKELVNDPLGFIDEIRTQISDNEIMLSYNGEISQEIILALLHMTEKKLDSSNEEKGLRSKLFNVMIRCLQNITVHAERNAYFKSSIFTISRLKEGGYAIYSGNAVRNDKVPKLKEKLNMINQMTEDDLHEFYKLWLTSRELNDKRGIGLGLVDIARKTGNDLDFYFEKIDENFSYFALRTVVKFTK